jgi:hypothetical protein
VAEAVLCKSPSFPFCCIFSAAEVYGSPFLILNVCLSHLITNLTLVFCVQNAGMVFVCEVLVDVIKHSFLAKFNEVKPAAYSEFLQALCSQVLISIYMKT